MKPRIYFFLVLFLVFSCSIQEDTFVEEQEEHVLEFGGDFSIMKKMEDLGGLYKDNGVVKEGMEIFSEYGFTWARMRLFHTPKLKGQVVNNLDYTIDLARKAKKYGMKVLLNFHYSDSYADPGHQIPPEAWKDLSFDELTDSIYDYSRRVINAMDMAGVIPDMVQIGNEINNGMVYPHGKIWMEPGEPRWIELAALLDAGIRGVKDADNGFSIPIMIHGATGGDIDASVNFYENIIKQGIKFDVIGLSYYPWWHGSFIKLESNIFFLSKKFPQEISIVETAYYANNWYPEPDQWILSIQPYPPTEEGQYAYLHELARIFKQHTRVKTIFYWKPDGLEIPKSGILFLGRSLFDERGNSFKGISAWQDVYKKP